MRQRLLLGNISAAAMRPAILIVAEQTNTELLTQDSCELLPTPSGFAAVFSVNKFSRAKNSTVSYHLGKRFYVPRADCGK